MYLQNTQYKVMTDPIVNSTPIVDLYRYMGDVLDHKGYVVLYYTEYMLPMVLCISSSIKPSIVYGRKVKDNIYIMTDEKPDLLKQAGIIKGVLLELRRIYDHECLSRMDIGTRVSTNLVVNNERVHVDRMIALKMQLYTPMDMFS